MVSLFLGTVGAPTFAFTVDRLSGKVTSVADIESLTNLPVLASVPEYQQSFQITFPYGGFGGVSPILCVVMGSEDVWIPLVDEPIGGIVQQVEDDDPEISALVDSPRRLLAFRTFAYIRVGVLLGQLLFDNDVPPYDGSETWIDVLLRDPKHHDALVEEIHAVAREIAADPKYVDDEPLGPDDEARERFRAFAREKLARDTE